MDSLVLLRAAPESMANLAPGAQLPVQVGQGLSVCVCVRVCARILFKRLCLGVRGWGRVWAQGSVSPGTETQASWKDKHCYQDLRVRLCKMGRIPAPLEA